MVRYRINPPDSVGQVVLVSVVMLMVSLEVLLASLVKLLASLVKLLVSLVLFLAYDSLSSSSTTNRHWRHFREDKSRYLPMAGLTNANFCLLSTSAGYD